MEAEERRHMLLHFFEIVTLRRRRKIVGLRFVHCGIWWSKFLKLHADMVKRSAKVIAYHGKLVVDYSTGREETTIKIHQEGEIRRFLGQKHTVTPIRLSQKGQQHFQIMVRT